MLKFHIAIKVANLASMLFWWWKTHYRRCRHLTKLPWQLPQQPGGHTDNRSGGGADAVVRIHCVWPWEPIHMSLRPPDDHGRGRDNPDEEELWLLHAGRDQKQEQHRQRSFPHRQKWHKVWLESQLEGVVTTRWGDLLLAPPAPLSPPEQNRSPWKEPFYIWVVKTSDFLIPLGPFLSWGNSGWNFLRARKD